jgi:hypothetical protein
VTPRRVVPAALVAAGLAVLAVALYLWLVQQKGDGRFEPTWWFVGLALLGAVEAACAAALPPPRQRIAQGASAVTLLVTAVLSPRALETSHGWALLGAVGLPLVGAAALCLLGAWRPRLRLTVPAVLVALVLVVLAVPSAGYLAGHGEGVGGASSAAQAWSFSSQPRNASRFLVDSPRESRHSHSWRIEEAKPSSRMVLNESSA